MRALANLARLAIAIAAAPKPHIVYLVVGAETRSA
jgi:hypothetical protein